MELTILTNVSGYLQEIEEQKKLWVIQLLQYLGIDISKIRKDEKVSADFFVSNDLQILSYAGSHVIKVFKGTDIVGEFFEPEFKLKQDEVGARYYEIKIKTQDVMQNDF